MTDEQLQNQMGGPRIAARQIDELIGLARGLAADGTVNQSEAEFLQKWLAANHDITDQPVIRTLFARVTEMLCDGVLDDNESRDLVDTLNALSSPDFELGEVLKATTLPICNPAPTLTFSDRSYCFTGTFTFGSRKVCEAAVGERGARSGSLTQKTNVLVIGNYATESWKHSAFGNKIIQACAWRDQGIPINIVTEQHWTGFL